MVKHTATFESNAFSQLASLVHLTVTVRVSLFDDMALLGSLVNLQTDCHPGV